MSAGVGVEVTTTRVGVALKTSVPEISAGTGVAVGTFAADARTVRVGVGRIVDEITSLSPVVGVSVGEIWRIASVGASIILKPRSSIQALGGTLRHSSVTSTAVAFAAIWRVT